MSGGIWRESSRPCVKNCGRMAEAYLRPAARGFPEKWIESELCEVCEHEEIRRDERRVTEQMERQRLEGSGMGAPRLATMEWKNFRSDHPARKRVAAMLRPAYSSLAKSGYTRNLFLCGGSGGGKTHLAVCFARAALKMGRAVRFWSWPDLCQEFRQFDLHSSKLALIAKLLRYEVLVIDDVGAEKATDFIVENLYLLVNKWDLLTKPGLIVTTNLTIDRFGQVYGDRIASRLCGMSLLVDFEGCPDGRIEKLL